MLRSAFSMCFFCLLLSPVLSWTPSHKVVSEHGTLYFLQVPEQDSLIFFFQASGLPELSEIEDSPLWAPSFLENLANTQPINEVKLGERVVLNKESQVFCTLNPDSQNLILEVEHRAQSHNTVKRICLEAQTGQKPFTRYLTIHVPFADHFYGLGEQLSERHAGESRADWSGRVRHSGSFPDSISKDPAGVFGNSLTHLLGGNVSNALFPVLVMADEQGTDALLFLDNPQDSHWDFESKSPVAKLRGGPLSGALSWGEEAQVLRTRYLEFTGRAPIPPRKAFGMWVSEYGFENWEELEQKAATLLENHFPVDGFVLDLQWFGGILGNSPDSSMGKLQFDRSNFPNPEAKISELKARGLGLITIEESYVAQNRTEFKELSERGYMVKSPDGSGHPHIIDRTPWWGIGSMIDYTNPEAADYWHQNKRQNLIELGILGHWTDLGEPEAFRHREKSEDGNESFTTPLYWNEKTQLEANNLFGFSWARSIHQNYTQRPENHVRRPFILARTGTAGIQRFGASLWSGDIGSNWESLRSHYVAQSHLAWSGIDYFGSDVGGFYRKAFKGSPDAFKELYTRWFAAACLTDIPLRPHVMNLGNHYETAPDRVGDIASNRWNLRRRYRLIPYLYSLAHRAWTEGEAVVAPSSLGSKVHGDLATSGNYKKIGSELLAALVLEPGSKSITIPLPEGNWYDFDSGEWLAQGNDGEVICPTIDQGHMKVPLLAREGAIIPVGSADASTPTPSEVELLLVPGATRSGEFTLYHDDGQSQDYLQGDSAVTKVSLSTWKAQNGTLVISGATGPYLKKLPQNRDITLRIAHPGSELRAIIGKQELPTSRDGHFWKVKLPPQLTKKDVTVKFFGEALPRS